MQQRTLWLFAAMLVLFAFYATMSLPAMPEIQNGLKEQTERLNTLDQGVEPQTAQN